MENEKEIYKTAIKSHGGPSMESIKAFYENEGLPFPPVPEDLAPRVRAVSPGIFGTRVPEKGLYALEPFIAEFQSGNVEDYLLMGVDGHGVASWAMHYYLVRGPLALFIQLRCGSAFEDTENANASIEATFEFVEGLIQEMDRADRAGRLPARRRMLIIETDFAPSRWAWVPDPPFQNRLITWNEEPPVLFDALMTIRELTGP